MRKSDGAQIAAPHRFSQADELTAKRNASRKRTMQIKRFADDDINGLNYEVSGMQDPEENGLYSIGGLCEDLFEGYPVSLDESRALVREHAPSMDAATIADILAWGASCRFGESWILMEGAAEPFRSEAEGLKRGA